MPIWLAEREVRDLDLQSCDMRQMSCSMIDDNAYKTNYKIKLQSVKISTQIRS